MNIKFITKIAILTLLFVLSSKLFCDYRQVWQLHSNAYAMPTLDEMKQKFEKMANGTLHKSLHVLSQREQVETAYTILESEELINEPKDLSKKKIDETKESKEKKEEADLDWDQEFKKYLDNDRKIINYQAFKDFNFFVGNPTNPSKSILNQINKTKTRIGYARLAKKLTELSKDPAKLKNEQDVIKTLLDNDTLQKNLSGALEEFAKFEPILQLLYNSEYQALSLLITEDLFFKFFPKGINEKLNKNKYAHIISKMLLIGFQDIISQVIVSSYLTHGIYKSLKKSFTKTISDALNYNPNINSRSMGEKLQVLLKFSQENGTLKDSSLLGKSIVELPLGYINIFKQIKDTDKIFNIIDKQVENTAQSIRMIWEIFNIAKSNPILYKNIPSIQNVHNFFSNPSEEYKQFVELASSSSSLDGTKVGALFGGRNLAAFSLLFELKKQLLPCLKAIANIDMYNSNSILFRQHQSTKNKMCFVKFVGNDKPFVSVKNIWNPLLDANSSVPNDLNIGATSRAKGYNMILTGPNESGKSTFQRSVIISLVFAQTLGMTFADEFIISPFDKIKFYQNPQDDLIAGKSLFRVQAEQFNKLFTIVPSEITFISSDEPATGANARICAAIAFSAAKELVNAPNCACILSTHFPLLAGLQDFAPDYFKNYKFDVIRNPDGTISYPYKLKEGVSDQHVELDVFKKEGLKASILENATRMLKKNEDVRILNRRSRL